MWKLLGRWLIHRWQPYERVFFFFQIGRINLKSKKGKENKSPKRWIYRISRKILIVLVSTRKATTSRLLLIYEKLFGIDTSIMYLFYYQLAIDVIYPSLIRDFNVDIKHQIENFKK